MKIVILVDGCFWHGHKGCKYFTQKCPTNRNQLRSPKAPFDTQSVTTLTPSSFGGGERSEIHFCRETWADTQNVANQRKGSLRGGYFSSSFLLHLLLHWKGGYIAVFRVLPEKQKLPISFENQEFAVNCFSSKWYHQESNRGHKDFQSFALPTELWYHSSCVLVMQRYNNFLN